MVRSEIFRKFCGPSLVPGSLRQALKDANKVHDKVAKAEDIEIKHQIIQMKNKPKTHFRKTKKPGRA